VSKEQFREHHLMEIWSGYEHQHLPLDLFISRYFRLHKAIGSKDRGYIAESLYGLIRWKGLVDYISNGRMDLDRRLKIYRELDFDSIFEDPSIPLHIKVSFPEVLFNAISGTHGEEKATEICRDSNFPAPTTIRVNALKTTRDELLRRWQGVYEISPCLHSPWGIVFHKKINFFTLPEFQQGLFEVQDEGSQLLASLVAAAPSEHVLDYCAGSGGKTLAFAPHMNNTGQIYLHDIRSHALQECRRRLKRAGIQNVQIVGEDDQRLKKMKKRMDWVLADVPCSGTGTLRRNPDMKYKFDEDTVPRLVGLQRQIFEKALSFLKPDGKIVYATCSILQEENQQQIEHFKSTYGLTVIGEPFQSLPAKGTMDGFFAAVMARHQIDDK
jgi:16S rRNA (cytosine(967)-C(5))-methyltransferase